jgi:hypothetical protein
VRRIPCHHLPHRSGVYRVVNERTGDCYVGGTGDLRQRGENHASALMSYAHRCGCLQAAYRRQRGGGFWIQVLELCEPEMLPYRETWWIAALRPSWNTETVVRPKRNPRRKMFGEPRLLRRKFYDPDAHKPPPKRYAAMPAA